jgi:hypothetical protein
VAHTGFAERAEQNYLKFICFGMFTAKKFGCPLGSHGVGGGGAFANLVDLADGFHGNASVS